MTSCIGIECKEGDVQIKTIENNLSAPVFIIPPDLLTTASQGEKRHFDKECNEKKFRRTKRARINKKRQYSVVWGQCGENSRAQLEASNDFEDVSKRLGGLGLLRALRSVLQSSFTGRMHQCGVRTPLLELSRILCSSAHLQRNCKCRSKLNILQNWLAVESYALDKRPIGTTKTRDVVWLKGSFLDNQSKWK
jgi:hypothetical protein